MRFAAYRQNFVEGLVFAEAHGRAHGVGATDARYPASLVAAGRDRLLAAGRALFAAPQTGLDAVELLPSLPMPSKALCMDLDHAGHSAESGFQVLGDPTVFGRFASSLIGHGAPMVRPRLSERLDDEGELSLSP